MATDDQDQVRGWIDAAQRIVVLTGAGISTDSGIPDFRGPQGLWTKDPKAEKSAHIDVYMSDPEVRKRSWQTRIGWMERQPEPNPGHRALVDLERRGKLDTLVTQNIDELHQRWLGPRTGHRDPRHHAPGHVHDLRRAGADGTGDRTGARR